MSYDDEWDDSDDWDQPDAADDDSCTYPCPECGQQIYDDAEQCPCCGQYIVFSSNPLAGKSKAWVTFGVIGIAAVVLALGLGFLALSLVLG